MNTWLICHLIIISPMIIYTVSGAGLSYPPASAGVYSQMRAKAKIWDASHITITRLERHFHYYWWAIFTPSLSFGMITHTIWFITMLRRAISGAIISFRAHTGPSHTPQAPSRIQRPIPRLVNAYIFRFSLNYLPRLALFRYMIHLFVHHFTAGPPLLSARKCAIPLAVYH